MWLKLAYGRPVAIRRRSPSSWTAVLPPSPARAKTGNAASSARSEVGLVGASDGMPTDVVLVDLDAQPGSGRDRHPPVLELERRGEQPGAVRVVVDAVLEERFWRRGGTGG